MQTLCNGKIIITWVKGDVWFLMTYIHSIGFCSIFFLVHLEWKLMERRNASKFFVMRYSSYDGQRAETSKTHAPSSIAATAREMVVFESLLTLVQQSGWASQPQQLQSKPWHPKTSSKHNNNNNNNNKPQIIIIIIINK